MTGLHGILSSSYHRDGPRWVNRRLLMCPRWMGVVWARAIGQKWSKESARIGYCVIASDSALLQEASAVESGDSAPIAGCSGPVPMVWAPRAARGGLAVLG